MDRVVRVARVGAHSLCRHLGRIDSPSICGWASTRHQRERPGDVLGRVGSTQRLRCALDDSNLAIQIGPAVGARSGRTLLGIFIASLHAVGRRSQPNRRRSVDPIQRRAGDFRCSSHILAHRSARSPDASGTRGSPHPQPRPVHRHLCHRIRHRQPHERSCVPKIL